MWLNKVLVILVICVIVCISECKADGNGKKRMRKKPKNHIQADAPLPRRLASERPQSQQPEYNDLDLATYDDYYDTKDDYDGEDENRNGEVLFSIFFSIFFQVFLCCVFKYR